MAEICFRTHEFATDPEGDMVYCNGVPGSQVAGWIRDALLKKRCACRGLIQEDYGWGFWVDAADCSIWVAVCYATPIDAAPTDVPEWQVAWNMTSRPGRCANGFGCGGGKRRCATYSPWSRS